MSMGGFLDVWSILGLLLILGIAVWGLRLLKQRLDEQRYQESLAELEFEGSVLSDFSMTGMGSQDMQFMSSETAPRASISAELRESSPPPAMPRLEAAYGGTEVKPSADMSTTFVMQQLKQSGLFQSIEGYIDLHGNAQGAAIILLRNGKRALLVPHMESEAFLRRHSRRVDYILMVGTDGKAVVVTPLEELISQNIMG